MELEKAIEELEELKETIKTAFWSERYIYKKVISIKTVLKELDTLQMNYKLLEEKFDGSAEEKVDKLTEELDKQTESYEEGYRQGYNEGYMAGAMEII